MKHEQYIIENIDNDLIIRWDGSPVLFDSQEEAEEFIEIFSKFFEGSNYKLTKGIYFLKSSINYKDIPKDKIDEQIKDLKE